MHVHGSEIDCTRETDTELRRRPPDDKDPSDMKQPGSIDEV